MDILQEVLAGIIELKGRSDPYAVHVANSIITQYHNLKQFAELLSFVRENDTVSSCKRIYGHGHLDTLKLRYFVSIATFCRATSQSESAEALKELEDVDEKIRRLLGSSHPIRTQLHRSITRARKKYDENVAKQRLYAGVG